MITLFKYGRFIFLAITALMLGACVSTKAPRPETFITPIESRLILQVPFHPIDDVPCGPAALAAVMTYNGLPTALDKARSALEPVSQKAMGREMAIWARSEGLKADFYAGTPEQLVEAVKANKPVIVRLDKDAGPVESGNYAVVVGYNPDGPVVNSCTINQQIVPWSEFLTGWYKASNLMVVVEPL